MRKLQMQKLGIIVAGLVLLAGPVFAQDLTGVWTGNDGGTYYLRQVGDRIFWLGESGDGGRTWTHVATGKVSGGRIILDWGDVPKGAIRNSGLLMIRVEGDRLVRVEGTGGFGGSEWRRGGPPVAGGAELRTMQLVRVVPQQNTAAFRHRPRPDIQMQTGQWDRTPSIMDESSTGMVILHGPRRITLAGDAGGSQGWGVDNFLLLEVFDEAGGLINVGLAGNTEPVILQGRQVQQFGPGSFNFAPRQMDITALFPVNRPFRLRATALDYGGVGWTSNVFLLVE